VRFVLVSVALLAALACGAPPQTPSLRLVQKGRFQALYGSGGRLLRVLEDRNGDRVADAVVLCGPDGQPRQGEIDTDLDGTVDRWEVFGPDGQLEKVGTSPDRSGRPQVWESPPPSGTTR
jgi:hypothetical protein